MQQTPLYHCHRAAGARIIEFGGWLMPVQYAGGIIAEHQHTRHAASLFDCSHMGQFRLRGDDAASALDALLPRAVSDLRPGRCRYNFLLDDSGGVIDDLIVYRIAASEFYLVVNAGTARGDLAHLQEHLPPAVSLCDESAETAKLDLQGPRTFAVLNDLGCPLPGLAYFAFRQAEIAGIPCLVSRTGYTGELGVELYLPANAATELWSALLAHPTVAAAGLGARDTLRLEMGYPLYGHELDRTVTPIAAGFGDFVDRERTFRGSAALDWTPSRMLRGICFDSRRAARAGAALEAAPGEPVGAVTSGAFAPSLDCSVALAYVDAKLATGTPIEALIGNSRLAGKLTALPFYRQGTARQRLD